MSAYGDFLERETERLRQCGEVPRDVVNFGRGMIDWDEGRDEVADAVDKAVNGDPIPGGLSAELLRRAYFAAPPARDGQHIGLQVVAHLVTARLLESPKGQR